MPSPASQPTPNEPPAEYVLGTGKDELDRLGLQHRFWSDAAHAAWRMAGIRIGHRVLDVGCGPGFASFDLAQLVGLGGAGEVLGVDESPNYVAFFNDQAAHRGLSQCRAVAGDVQKLEGAVGAKAGTFDLAYARWVLCFVPSPGDVLAGVASALKRGGKFCIHDYFNYRSMTFAPRRESHDKVVAATVASWRDRGGDSDVMGRMPRLLKEHGFRLDHLTVHQRVARPTDTMFQWLNVWWRVYAPKLVQMGYLAKEDQEQLFRDLDEIAQSDVDFVVVPPVYEIIATRL